MESSLQNPTTRKDDAFTVSLGFDAVLSHFEQGWQAGARPDLVAYVRAAGALHRPALLCDLIQIDLEYRLKAGERARLEEYVQQFSELAVNVEGLLDLAAWEFRLRRRTEPELRVEDYLARLGLPEPLLRERLAGEAERPPSTLSAEVGQTAEGVSSPPGFQLLSELGHGGMGVVYRARQVGLGREVAIKMIRGAGVVGEAARRRFQREAHAVAQLKHPAIVPIYTTGEHQGQPYFVMELLSGGSLADKLAGTPWPPREAAELVAAVAGAVQHAHERGIIHRDLKPANVLLDEQGRPHVTDFGLARVTLGEKGRAPGRPDGVDWTCDGSIVGTPAYMAPEQAVGRLVEMGPHTDVFGLGALLYHLLTGRPPYKGSSQENSLLEASRCSPPSVKSLNPHVPTILGRICAKAMAADARKRYGSAAELQQALQGFVQRPRRLVWVGAVVLAAIVVAGAGVGIQKWNARPAKVVVGPGREEPLRGSLSVRVSRPGDANRQGLGLDQPGTLPLREGDALRLHVRLNREAYLYLVWLGSGGEVELLYPGNRDVDLDHVPAKQPCVHLQSPEDGNEAWPIEGKGGLETVLLLARTRPLPAAVRLAELIGKPPLEPKCEPAELIHAEADEGRVSLATPMLPGGIQPGSLQVQDRRTLTRELLERLAPHFEMVRVWRFSYQPRNAP